MGCCVSTTTKSATKSTRESRETSEDQLAPPPPPQLEEETVKEVVLSETTIPHSPPTNLHEDINDKIGIQIQQSNVESTATMNVPTYPMVVTKPIEKNISISSYENSVRESFNERFLPAPAPEPEKFVVNDEELTKKSMEVVPMKWKNSVQVAAGKERRRRSPARRPVEEVSQRQNMVQRLSRASPAPGRCGRRDSGQVVGRPATFEEVNKGKNVIDKDLNFSEGEFSGDRWSEKSIDRNVELQGELNGEVSVEDVSGESFENPLVSLECFIFL